MGFTLQMAALTKDQFDQVLADTETAFEVFEANQHVDVDKMWDAMTSIVHTHTFPGSFFVFGRGEDEPYDELSDEDFDLATATEAIGTMLTFTSHAVVTEAAAELATLTPEVLMSRYNPAALYGRAAYPDIWDRTDDNLKEQLISVSLLVIDLFTFAAAHGLGIARLGPLD